MSPMPTYIDWTKFSSLVTRALAGRGELANQTRAKWDISMGCEKPFEVILASQVPDSPFAEQQTVRETSIRWLDVLTPCRKCGPCLVNRRKLWRRRMEQEIVSSNRNWFCTFTINPHHRFIFACRAGSHDYHASYGEISKEMTKFFKRLRKKGFKFRYILVAESHKDGYPHLHAILHEISVPIPKRAIQDEWPYGFTTVKLIDESASQAAFYVAKYLAKDARTRIRASQHYGQSVRDLFEELENLLKA